MVDSPVTIASTTSVPTSLVYASVGRRWTAAFVDGLVIGLINFGLGMLIGIGLVLTKINANSVSTLTQVLGFVVAYTYYVFMIGKWGQTLGKKLLKIKVVTVGGGQVPGYQKAFIREVVGKFISAIALLLGYLWAFWDKKKQTWHDKMAQTVVLKI